MYGPDANTGTGERAMTTKTNDAALGAFIARKTEIDAMLERLRELSDDHFDVMPEEVNWGDVGTLEHYAELLKRITDAAFRKGEYTA